MNPMLENQLKLIRADLDVVREIVVTGREDKKKQHEAYVKLTKQYWQRGSEIAVLKQNDEEFRQISAENEAMRERERQVMERLERILSHTKALATGLRP
jgi:uncharacterized membrane protein YgaE (UPF0421/DUF939 family)